MDIEKIYTELSLEKIENQPTGPEGKRIKDYKELFAERNVTKETKTAEFPAKKILMKADPGMGKTTHGKKMTCDWAKGFFTAMSVVFFVSMKLVRPGDAIENIIIQQTPVMEGLSITPVKVKAMVKAILDQFSTRCLIIFDGFDEFYSKNEDVLKIIRGQKLLHCNIVVTSRPHSVEDIEEHFHTIIKIQGFSEEYARTYVSKLLRERDKLDAVIQFNFRNFVIGSDTFTCPMVLMFICILVNNDEIDLGKNSVADPGFSPGGSANSQKSIILSIFCQKLHENERNWTRGARPWRPPLDSPMELRSFGRNLLEVSEVYLQ